MGNLNSNTEYNSTGTQSPLRGFAGVTKILQQNSQKSSSDTFKSGLLSHYSPEQFNSYFGSKTPQTLQPNTGIPVNQPVAPQDPTKTQPLPEGYDQWEPITDKNRDFLTAPTEQTVSRNWPLALGGGQYSIDSNSPGALIKSYRKIMEQDINPGAKQKVLGNLSPRLFQVDHIVPLWLGGTDTLQNLQVLDNVTHERKTAVQAVALTLLTNKKIDLKEAKLMALTYKDKDSKGLPNANDTGYIPIDIAEKYAKKWKDDIAHPSMWKFFGESFKENMANFGKGIPILGEFAKGLVGGTGMVGGTEALPESGTVGKVSNFAGNLVTMMTGIGLVSKGLAGLGAFGKIAKAGSTPFLKYSGTGINALDKLTGLGKATIATQQTARGIKLTQYTEKEIAKALGQVDIGNALGVSKWTTVGTKMYHSALSLAVYGQMGLLTREMTKQEEFDFGKNIKQATNDIVFGGLLGGAAKFAKGGQSIPGYAYVGSATTSWSLMNGASIEDALKEGITMTALHGMGYRKGAVGKREMMLNNEVRKEALAGANTYVGDIIPQHQKNAPVTETFVFDHSKIYETNKRFDTFKQKYPDLPISQNGKTITNTGEALVFLEQEAKQTATELFYNSNKRTSDIRQKAANENRSLTELEIKTLNESEKKVPSQSDLEAEFRSITTQFNELRNWTLPVSEQPVKSMNDLYSVSQQMRTDLGAKGTRNENTPRDLTKGDYDKIYLNYNGTTIPGDPEASFLFTEKFHNVGATRELGSKEQATLQEMATGKDIDGKPVFYEKRYAIGEINNPMTQSFFKRLYIEQQRNPKLVGADQPLGVKLENPDKVVQWFAIQYDGPNSNKIIAKKPIGYVPQATSYTKENNVNKEWPLVDKRIQHLQETHKNSSVEELKKAIDADRSMRATSSNPKALVDVNVAREISDRLKIGEKIPTDEFQKMIGASDPFFQYSSTMNNVTIYDATNDAGSNYIIGNFSKLYQQAGRERLGDPRKMRSEAQAFSEFEGLWIPGFEGKAVSKSSVPIERSLTVQSNQTPIQKGISNVVKKQEAKKTSEAISEVLPKVEQPTTNINKTSFDPYKGKAVSSASAFSSQEFFKLKEQYPKAYGAFKEISQMSPEMKATEDGAWIKQILSELTPVERKAAQDMIKFDALSTRIPDTSSMAGNISDTLKNNFIKEKTTSINENAISVPSTSLPETSNITSVLQNQPKVVAPVEKTQNITPSKSRTPMSSLTEDSFSTMKERIDDLQIVGHTSPASQEKEYMNIINSFRAKPQKTTKIKMNNKVTYESPKMSNEDFQKSIENAKERATAYVENVIDDTWGGRPGKEGQQIFGTNEVYSRAKKKTVLENIYNKLNKRNNPSSYKDEDPISGGTNLMPLTKGEQAQRQSLKNTIQEYNKLDEGIKILEQKTQLNKLEENKLRDLKKKQEEILKKYDKKNDDKKLSEKYGLKLDPPDQYGNQYLSEGTYINKYGEEKRNGEPVFSDEANQTFAKGTPLEYWGSDLEKDWDTHRDLSSSIAQKWGGYLEEMKNPPSGPMAEYGSKWAKMLDVLMNKKFNPKGHGWQTSWTANSMLKGISKEGYTKENPFFSTMNENEKPIDLKFRDIAAGTMSKTPEEAYLRTGKSQAITKAKSEEARLQRLEDYSTPRKESAIPEQSEGYNDTNPNMVETFNMKRKEPTQLKDTLDDMTPFDIVMNGINNTLAREKVIDNYETLRKELDNPATRKETTIDKQTGKKIPGTKDLMEEEFKKIKAFSVNIPEEVKNWKLGEEIPPLTNGGAPNGEQGMRDAFAFFTSKILKKGKGTPGYLSYKELREEVLNNTTLPKKVNPVSKSIKSNKKGSGWISQTTNDGSGGLYDGQGGMWSNIGTGIKDFIQYPFSSVTRYQRPQEQTSQIDYPRLRESIRFNETNLIKNPYSFSQPSSKTNKYGNANGAYQVTNAELSERSKQFLGRKITPKEFLATPNLQDQYMDGKFKYLQSQGYTTPQDILASHRGGFSDTSSAARAKRLIERANYISAAMKYYNSHPIEVTKL